jgi:hypothetical protein
MMWLIWPSMQQTDQKLNQSNITELHWFYLMTATCIDPYLEHHQAVFINMLLLIELSQYGYILMLIVKIVTIYVILAKNVYIYILWRIYAM